MHPQMLHDKIAILDELLDMHAAQIGRDLPAYRNHAYRVANLCAVIASPDRQRLEKIAIAAAFHDLGIWTDRTFDYLQPSVRAASAFLADAHRVEWLEEIAAMILQHHKVRRDAGAHELVEPFRRADWIDVSFGLRSFGVPRAVIREIFDAWPNEGFHKRLLQLELGQLRAHPTNPLPMMRW